MTQTMSGYTLCQTTIYMLAGHHKVTFQVDTGATLNTLHTRYADNIKPTTRKLKMWNNTEAAPLGICHTVVKNPKNKKTYSIEFMVVRDNYTPLRYTNLDNLLCSPKQISHLAIGVCNAIANLLCWPPSTHTMVVTDSSVYNLGRLSHRKYSRGNPWRHLTGCQVSCASQMM